MELAIVVAAVRELGQQVTSEQVLQIVKQLVPAEQVDEAFEVVRRGFCDLEPQLGVCVISSSSAAVQRSRSAVAAASSASIASIAAISSPTATTSVVFSSATTSAALTTSAPITIATNTVFPATSSMIVSNTDATFLSSTVMTNSTSSMTASSAIATVTTSAVVPSKTATSSFTSIPWISNASTMATSSLSSTTNSTSRWSASSTVSSSPSSTNVSSTSIGLIAGAAAGGVALLILAVLVGLIRRHYVRKMHVIPSDSESSIAMIQRDSNFNSNNQRGNIGFVPVAVSEKQVANSGAQVIGIYSNTQDAIKPVARNKNDQRLYAATQDAIDKAGEYVIANQIHTTYATTADARRSQYEKTQDYQGGKNNDDYDITAEQHAAATQRSIITAPGYAAPQAQLASKAPDVADAVIVLNARPNLAGVEVGLNPAKMKNVVIAANGDIYAQVDRDSKRQSTARNKANAGISHDYDTVTPDEHDDARAGIRRSIRA